MQTDLYCRRRTNLRPTSCEAAAAMGVKGLLVLCACAAVLAAGCKKEEVGAAKQGAKEPAGGSAAIGGVVDIDGAPAAAAAAAPVVTVYGKTLNRGDLERQMQQALRSPQMQGAPPELAAQMQTRIRQDAIERFVAQAVLVHEAETQKVSVSDEDRKGLLDELKGSLPPGLTLEQALAANGIDPAEFHRQITEDLMIRKMLDAHTASIAAPTEEEVKAFYTNQPSYFQAKESAHARHVLVKFEAGDDAAAKAAKKEKADKLREQLVGGADFAAVATASSDCPSKKKGGDLGNFSRGQMAPAFEKAAFTQETNAIGPVIETEFGYHVVQVLDRREAGVTPLAEAQKDISEYLHNQKKRQSVAALVEKLKPAANVQYAK